MNDAVGDITPVSNCDAAASRDAGVEPTHSSSQRRDKLVKEHGLEKIEKEDKGIREKVEKLKKKKKNKRIKN